MIQPKIQEVYVPTSDNTALMVGTIDKYDYYKSFQKERNVEEVERITFTPQEFEQFKREFGSALLELAADNASTICDNEAFEDGCWIDKESITSVLDDYLLNNKI